MTEEQFLDEFVKLRDQLPHGHALIRRRGLRWSTFRGHGRVRLSTDGEVTLEPYEWMSPTDQAKHPGKVRAELLDWLRKEVEESKASIAKGVATRARRRAARLKAVTDKWLAGEGAVYANRDRCACCRKLLTDPESRARGIGPECWEDIVQAIERASVRTAAE